MFPRIGKYLPVLLADGYSLICGAADAGTFTAPLVIAAGMGASCFAAGIPVFNRKRL